MDLRPDNPDELLPREAITNLGGYGGAKLENYSNGVGTAVSYGRTYGRPAFEPAASDTVTNGTPQIVFASGYQDVPAPLGVWPWIV